MPKLSTQNSKKSLHSMANSQLNKARSNMNSHKHSTSKATSNNVLIISDLKSPDLDDMPPKELESMDEMQKKAAAQA